MIKDQQMPTVLRTWMEEEPARKPDRSRVVSNVVGQLGSARQHRRRWRPFRHQATIPPTTDQATDYRPTSTPAPNGHSPTITGRTQSMFSPAKAITAGALVFALGGVLLIAQPFDQQGDMPGAATDAKAMRPALVTGTVVHHYPSGTEETTFPEGLVRRTHSTGETGRVEMSDPRLTGDVTFDYTLDFIPDPIVPDVEGVDAGEFARFGVELGWATLRIENDAGTWDGQLVCAPTAVSHGFEDPCLIELTGSAAYEGLSAVLVEGDRLNIEDGNHEAFALDGLIFAGNLPPDR